MRLNGKVYDNAELKRIAGYVMQDDLLNGHLTVYETLTYTANLKLGANSTEDEREEAVLRVIKQMGLTKSQDVIVGVPEKKVIKEEINHF